MRQVDISLWNIYKIVKILKWQKPTKRFHLQSSPHIGNSDLAQVFSVGGLVQGVTYLLRWVESVFWTVLQDTFFLQWAHSYSHPGQVNISGQNWLQPFPSTAVVVFCLAAWCSPLVRSSPSLRSRPTLPSSASPMEWSVTNHETFFSDVNNWKSLKKIPCAS